MLSLLCKYFRITRFIHSNYFSKGPVCVDIELSNKCNLKCKMCWFHGESGIGDRYLNSEMTTAEILGLIDQLIVYRPHIYFGGGEPFIREDFLEIIAYVKKFNLQTSFTTNGILLDKQKIQKIVQLGVDHIAFSIDGPEELHDKMRGQGNYRKVMSNMQHFLNCKQGGNIKKPLITVNITISPSIVGHLKKTINSIKKMTGDKVDYFTIHHLWFITPTELQLHKATVNKNIDRTAHGSGTHYIPLSQCIDSNALSDEIFQLKSEKKIKFFPNLKGKAINEFYSDGYRLKKRCVAPFLAVLVKPNGDLKFCPDEWIDDYILGNIREDTFENIWNGKSARHFRSIIFREKQFPACKRCSWMHNTF